jgi:hypothetical protein
MVSTHLKRYAILMLVLLQVSSGISFAQLPGADGYVKAASKRVEVANSAKILVQSFAIGSRLPPEERTSHLARLVQVAVKIHPDLGYLWSEQLFQLAAELPPTWNKIAWEQAAVTNLSRVDPDHAMEMFGMVDSPIPLQNGSFPDDVRAYGAQTIFREFWTLHRLAGLDRLRRVAQHVGETGEYPYLAMAPIVSELADGHQELAVSIFTEALTFYQRRSKFSSENLYFIQFLQMTRHSIQFPLVKEGIEEIVQRLTTEKSPSQSVYRGQVYGNRGGFETNDENDRLLIQVLPLLREIDPAAARSLVEERPSLRNAAAATGDFQHAETITFSTKEAAGVPGAEQYQMESARADYVEQIAKERPEEALTLARTIANPGLRVIAFARLAQNAAPESPQRARGFLDQSRSDMRSIQDDEDKLRALTAVARVEAALKDSRAVVEAVQQGFELGGELFEQDLELHPGKLAYRAVGFAELTELAGLGAKFAPEEILSHISRIRSEALKANLLVDAADGISQVEHAPPKQ